MVCYQLLTETGNRKINEDAADAKQIGERYCFALADGLGGHEGGEIASKIVVEKALEVFSSYDENSEDCMRSCFEESQNYLLEEQRRIDKPYALKTTLVLLFIDQEKVFWGHIGDTRIYEFVDHKLRARSLDHSVPQMLVAAGEITEEQIRGHADRNRLLRVMGIEWDRPRYTLCEAKPLQENSSYLLCTDGFWEWILEKEMLQSLEKAQNQDEWLSLMETKVKSNAGEHEMDNYSAITVFVRS